MSEPTTDQPDLEPAPTVVAPQAGTRLEQLHAAYADAKAAADEANANLKTITDALKVELTQAAPGSRRITLQGPTGPALGLTYSESTRINTRAIKPVLDQIKTADPAQYARLMTTSGSWRISALRGEQ
jgi:hypothetical protein